jgi:hypothetical protein
MNLMSAGRLIARYTNQRSTTSRAPPRFQVWKRTAEIIDKYFLKNFEDDPDYPNAG